MQGLTLIRVQPTGAKHTRLTVFDQGAVAGHLTLLIEDAQSVIDALMGANGSNPPPTLEDMRPKTTAAVDPGSPEDGPETYPPAPKREPETASEAAAQQSETAQADAAQAASGVEPAGDTPVADPAGEGTDSGPSV